MSQLTKQLFLYLDTFVFIDESIIYFLFFEYYDYFVFYNDITKNLSWILIYLKSTYWYVKIFTQINNGLH